MRPTRAVPTPVVFRTEITLLKNDEYEIAYGYSELVGDHCIAERWYQDTPWFCSHPDLTKAKVLSLIAANIDGTNYDKIIDLAQSMGILLLKGETVQVKNGMDVFVKHHPFLGEKLDPSKLN